MALRLMGKMPMPRQAREGIWLTASRDRPSGTRVESSKQGKSGQTPLAGVSRDLTARARRPRPISPRRPAEDVACPSRP